MDVILQLFGAYRPFGDSLTLTLPEPATVADIREPLKAVLKACDSHAYKQGLVDSSRFATETEVLAEDAILKHGMLLAVIPPVSGG